MNTLIKFFGFIILFSIAQKGFSQDSNFQIYLSLGQSNMEGNAKIDYQDTFAVQFQAKKH
jgi:hypothetical protein